jgi:MFS family permease
MLEKEQGAHKRKQRWVIGLFFFLAGILTASWSSRIPDVQQKLQLDNASLGRVLFFLPAGLVIGLLFAGRWVARYGTRRIMLITSVMACLALVFAALATASVQLMVALFLIGAVRTTYNLSINTAAVDLQKQYDKPIVARFHGIWSVACFVSAGIGTAMIINNVKPLPHFILVALLVAISAILLMGKTGPSAQITERRPFFVKPDKYLFLLGLIALSAMLCEGAMFDWSVNYFEKVLHAEKAFVTLGYSSFIGAMALGRLIGDRLIARFGIFRMLFFNGVLLSAGCAIAALFPTLLFASLGFLLIGFGDSTLVPMIYLLASQTRKMPSGYAIQAVTLIGYSGFLIGPLFIGNVSQHFGMATAFLCLSGVCLLISFLSVQVRRLSVNA